MSFIDFDIREKLHLVTINYVCPDCGITESVPFIDSREHKKLADDEELLEYLELHIPIETLELLYEDEKVVFNAGKLCQGTSCTTETRVNKINEMIRVPSNFKTVEVANDLSLMNEFGTILTGNVGVGKTYYAISLLKRYLLDDIKETKTYKFINVCELLFQMHSEFNKRSEYPILQQCMEVDLLILDDLGTEKFSEWSTSQMYMLLNYRHDNVKQTIITTNLTLNEIAEMFNRRIASRLSSYTLANIKGKDRRTR